MLELTDDNFKAEVLESNVPVLVDFWAPWCGPCQRMLPVMDELAKEVEGKSVKIAKMNVDENQATPGEYGILSIPTLIVFKEGKAATTLQGAQSIEQLKEALGV